MKEILQEEIQKRGKKQVAFELGISVSTLTLYMQGKYPAPERVEERAKKIYSNGRIQCPVLGEISPAQCAENYELAEKVGRMVSNPEKLKLYRACMKCEIRK
ncbi:hypothetical protein THER_1668 [Thermodesulfovibrio sp. N1]|uniref:hypothetical protein n=1 Tax=unclassified Thermodesulfovibrio TaxID=2645936 RepID=UPI000839E387|nr:MULTISPECIES: hypothetical protein [unclassified Thermodesulfovibrio]MDI1471906.1 hypothetical protein [Thermodesulfovibrio sp. 1176]ODA43629.1 hypothetical protein THER_1668 [Thermodesulfovibrio sp. N1]